MAKPSPLRIAHISDLHFAKLSLNPLQIFSKRFIGNVNSLLSRKKVFLRSRLDALIPLFEEHKISHVIITGDVSTTSYKKEFALAKDFVQELEKRGISVFTLPGNHDRYTQSACKNRLFYQFFKPQFSAKSKYNLKDHGIALVPLKKNWWLITLDTSRATSWVSSQGYFSEGLEQRLEEVLASLPKEDRVIVANHFPFFRHDAFRKTLRRARALRALIQRHPQIALYLHGHTHRHCIADLRINQFPIILDSGSTAHRDHGSWNMIDIQPTGCTIDAFHWNGAWQSAKQQQFSW